MSCMRLLCASPAGHAGARARAPGARKKLVNAEVFGDFVYACEPKDKQRDRERADERERSQAKARDPVEHELPRATGQPPRPYVSRERFGRHRTRSYAASGRLVLEEGLSALGSGDVSLGARRVSLVRLNNQPSLQRDEQVRRREGSAPGAATWPTTSS